GGRSRLARFCRSANVRRRASCTLARAMPSLLTVTFNPAVDLSTRTPAIEPSHKLRCAPPQIHPGGGGINVARVVARFGGGVTALYPAGGATGERLRLLLEAEGVPSRCISIREETRESFSVVEEA